MKKLPYLSVFVGLTILSSACGGGDEEETTSPTTMSPVGGTMGTPGMDDTGGVDETGGLDETGDAEALSFATDVRPIIDANCVAGCHEPGGAWPTLPFDEDPYTMLLEGTSLQVPSMPLVTPEDPENSYLFHKINGTFDVPVEEGGAGAPEGYRHMPYDPETLLPAPLAEEDVETVRLWIAGGALE